jgi:hypothetical protein
MKKSLSIVILSAALVLAACGKAPSPTTVIPPDDGSTASKISEYNKVTGASNSADPVHGKETVFAYGAVSGISPVGANGVGFMHTYADGVSQVQVNLNILQAKSGTYHTVWLTDGTTYLRVGTLNSIIGDARHSTKLETKENIGSMHMVLVTLENSEGAAVPSSNHEAEGTLRVVTK